MSKSLAVMADEVWTWAESKGWEPSTDTFGDAIALTHSELSEALEAFRDWGLRPMYKLDGVVSEGNAVGHAKPEGVPSEFADVLIRLLHYAKRYGIDLELEFDRKMVYNHTRAFRHGGRAL